MVKKAQECLDELLEGNSEEFEYITKEVINKSHKIEIRCLKHNEVFWQPLKYHMQGRLGCPTCGAAGSICETIIKRNKSFADEIRYGYLIKLEHPETKEWFYKVGITKNPKSRFRSMRPYKVVEKLSMKEGRTEDLYYWEQTTLNLMHMLGWKHESKFHFDGHLECFKLGDLDELRSIAT